MSSVHLLSVKNFTQRISWIRKVRKCRRKESSQTGQNNNLVIKHSQRPLVPPQGLYIIFWAISCELPHQVEEGNHRMTRLYPWNKLPQLWELASKKWEQTDPGTEDKVYLKQLRWCWLGNYMTNFKMILGIDCCFCTPFLLPLIHPWNPPLKALTHWLSVGKSAFGFESHQPSPWFALLQNKADVPFHQPCLSGIGFLFFFFFNL